MYPVTIYRYDGELRLNNRKHFHFDIVFVDRTTVVVIKTPPHISGTNKNSKSLILFHIYESKDSP